MTVYFVTHPNMGVTSLVTAPSTEKARTTFLDWLERNDHIRRADRQYWRKNMIAERMEDPQNVTADVDLAYGYMDSGNYRVRASEEHVQYPRREVPQRSFDTFEEEPESEPEPELEPEPEPEPKPERKLSPIQKLALGR